MIITIEQAEQKLIDTLKNRIRTQMICRCLSIKSSLLSHFDFDAFAEQAHPLIIDTDTEMFVCHDRDAFIVAKGISYKVFEKILDIMHQSFDIPRSILSKAVSLHDIQKDGHDLVKHIEQKAIALRKSAKRQEQDSVTQKNLDQKESILNLSFDQGMIDSLPKRRAERSALQVLVVEDDAFSRKLVSSALEGKYETILAEDGQGGLMQYVTHAPDVLFLDIELPDITGHDVLQKVLEMDPDAFVIMLSGNGNKENIFKAMKTGAKGFVGKPFTKDKLLQYILKCPKAHEIQHLKL